MIKSGVPNVFGEICEKDMISLPTAAELLLVLTVAMVGDANAKMGDVYQRGAGVTAN